MRIGILPKRTRILGLITVVAGLSLALALFLMPPVERADEVPAFEGSSWFCPVVLLGLAGLEWLIARRRQQRWMELVEEGNRLFQEGKLSQALERYTRASDRARSQPLPRFCMGFSRLSLWQLSAARVDLEASLTLRPLYSDFDSYVRYAAPLALALLDALEGHGARARQRLDALSLDHDDAIQTVAQAIIACREQRWPEARSLARRPEVLRFEGTLGALGRTLEIWSSAEAGEALRQVDRVALFSEAVPDELYAEWPELRAFLEKAPHV